MHTIVDMTVKEMKHKYIDHSCTEADIPDQNEVEEWRSVFNFPKYTISNLGRVKSFHKHSDGVILKQMINPNGYSYVNLANDYGVFNTRIHRIVAETFLDNPDGLPVVNHKDGNKLNNRSQNLEWTTQSENIKHAYDIGLNSAYSQYKQVIKCDKKTGDPIAIYPSMSDACRSLGFTGRKEIKGAVSNIRRCINGGRPSAFGYRWLDGHRGFLEVPKKFKMHDNRAIIPARATKSSAGYDFYILEDMTIPPNSSLFTWSDICAYMKDDEVLTLNIRSSIGVKMNLMLDNTVGIIDSDYFANPDNFGNIGISFYNYGSKTVHLKKGERVAQGIFLKYLSVSDDNPISNVRTGGYGSSGR